MPWKTAGARKPLSSQPKGCPPGPRDKGQRLLCKYTPGTNTELGGGQAGRTGTVCSGVEWEPLEGFTLGSDSSVLRVRRTLRHPEWRGDPRCARFAGPLGDRAVGRRGAQASTQCPEAPSRWHARTSCLQFPLPFGPLFLFLKILVFSFLRVSGRFVCLPPAPPPCAHPAWFQLLPEHFRFPASPAEIKQNKKGPRS